MVNISLKLHDRLNRHEEHGVRRAGKEKQKVDAVSLTMEEEARAKKEASKVCKQRRCVHGRLHPHYFRPKKFFPICLWNQLPVKFPSSLRRLLDALTCRADWI